VFIFRKICTCSFYGIAYRGVLKQYHKTACTSLPEDEHLVVRNMSKAINKLNRYLESVHFAGFLLHRLHRYIAMHGYYYIGISQCTVLIT
jgi:hypothetical protein